jgi:hypothetical protein
MNSLGEIDLVIIKYRAISLNIMEIWKSSSSLLLVLVVELSLSAVELSLSEIISILKCVNNNYELFYCCSCSRPFCPIAVTQFEFTILRMAWASCGREKLALLQLPVLVKYRIALVLVPLASDSRILSLVVVLVVMLVVVFILLVIEGEIDLLLLLLDIDSNHFILSVRWML